MFTSQRFLCLFFVCFFFFLVWFGFRCAKDAFFAAPWNDISVYVSHHYKSTMPQEHIKENLKFYFGQTAPKPAFLDRSLSYFRQTGEDVSVACARQPEAQVFQKTAKLKIDMTMCENKAVARNTKMFRYEFAVSLSTNNKTFL